MDVPGVVRGAPLLPEPVEVAAQVDRDEEQLRLIGILRPDAALQQVLMEQLHGTASAYTSLLEGDEAEPDRGLACWPCCAEGAVLVEVSHDSLSSQLMEWLLSIAVRSAGASQTDG